MKINVIDIVLVVVLVGAAIAGFLFVRNAGGGDGEDARYGARPFVLQFYLGAADNILLRDIREGDAVFDNGNAVFLGNVVAVDRSYSYHLVPTPDGRLERRYNPGYASVVISVVRDAVPTENGIVLGNQRYGIGHSLSVRVGQAVLWMRISGLWIQETPEQPSS